MATRSMADRATRGLANVFKGRVKKWRKEWVNAGPGGSDRLKAYKWVMADDSNADRDDDEEDRPRRPDIVPVKDANYKPKAPPRVVEYREPVAAVGVPRRRSARFRDGEEGDDDDDADMDDQADGAEAGQDPSAAEGAAEGAGAAAEGAGAAAEGVGAAGGDPETPVAGQAEAKTAEEPVKEEAPAQEQPVKEEENAAPAVPEGVPRPDVEMPDVVEIS